MRTRTLQSSSRILPLLLALTLGGQAARAQIYVTKEAELKARRTARNSGYTSAVKSLVSETSPSGQGINYRYAWMMCNGTSFCMPWKRVDEPTPHYERDPACQYKKVVDRLLVEESRCTFDNFAVRRTAERCQRYAASAKDGAFSGAKLEAGHTGFILKAFQPGNPDGYGGDWYLYDQFPSCANSLEVVSTTGPKDFEPGRKIDVGIGDFKQWTAFFWTGGEEKVGKVNTMGPFLAAFTDNFVAVHTPEEESNMLGWTENYLQAGNVDIILSNEASGLKQPLVAQYIKDFGGPPNVFHVFCIENRASAFVQGFSNPAGGAHPTATAANIDITTSNAKVENGGNLVQGLIADLRAVSDVLAGLKSVNECQDVQQKWRSECGGNGGMVGGWFGGLATYAHSMGAIAVRSWDLQTRANIGSVDNSNGPSYRNNCDPIPWVTQTGIDYLLHNITTTNNPNLVTCTRPGQMDCRNGSKWVSSPFGASTGPRTWACDEPNNPRYGELCKHWWCGGKPGNPTTRLYSGRTGMPTKTSLGRNPAGLAKYQWDYCPGEAAYNQDMKACLDLYLTGNDVQGNFWNCLKAVWEIGTNVTAIGSDHLLDGNGGDVQYNGYRVLDGLNNLGKPTGALVYTALIDNKTPPPVPPKPVFCGDGICDPDFENQQNCPQDCHP